MLLVLGYGTMRPPKNLLRVGLASRVVAAFPLTLARTLPSSSLRACTNIKAEEGRDSASSSRVDWRRAGAVFCQHTKGHRIALYVSVCNHCNEFTLLIPALDSIQLNFFFNISLFLRWQQKPWASSSTAKNKRHNTQEAVVRHLQ